MMDAMCLRLNCSAPKLTISSQFDGINCYVLLHNIYVNTTSGLSAMYTADIEDCNASKSKAKTLNALRMAQHFQQC